MIRFGTDGWRARVGDGFDETAVVRVADALGELLCAQGGRKVVVGYDTRQTSAPCAAAAASALAGRGLDVVLASTFCPTPALAWTVAHDDDASAGLMVTASHASADYNGVKIRMADGGVPTRQLIGALEERLRPEPLGLSGPVRRLDVMGPYLEALQGMVDARAIAGAAPHVVVDPLYGAARGHLADMLRRLGAQVSEVHGEPSADFGGLVPASWEAWLADCRAVVRESGASAGFVLDGDAARVCAVDENGRYVTSQQLMALILQLFAEMEHMSGRVVITSPCSVLVRRQAARLGCPLTVTPVGFSWIRAEMAKGDVLIGGEESGGIGIPAHVCERDGMLAHLLVCDLMARTGKTLGRLVDDLEDKVGHMDYGRRDVQMDAASLQMFRNILPGLCPQTVAGMRPVSVDHAEGLRLGFADDAWLMLRASGTNALVRVYAEAPTVLERDALLDEGCALARGELE